MALEFAERVKRIPAYPVGGRLRARAGRWCCSPATSRPYPPLPRRCAAAIDRGSPTLNRYPDPTSARLRGALSDRYGVPAERIAVGNGSCDILLAAGEALLEPGAELVYAWPSFSVYPQLAAASGARAVTVALDARRAPRPRRDAARDHRRHAPRDRLQPQQPDEHRAAARRRSPPSSRQVPEPRLRDPRRGLLRVQPARRPRRVDRAARRATRTSCCCGPSRRSTASAGCASASRCAARRSSRARSTRSASRSSSTPLAQAAAVEALRHQDEVIERVTRTVAERIAMERGAARARASPWPTRRPTSAGCASARADRRGGGRRGPRRARRARARRQPRSAPASPRCASPTGSPRRTPASWTRSSEVLAATAARS